MMVHDNRLLADNSHEISYLIFSKLGKMSQNLSSVAVVIDALRVKDNHQTAYPLMLSHLQKDQFALKQKQVISKHSYQNIKEYDQEMPLSQTSDLPMAPQGRDAE